MEIQHSSQLIVNARSWLGTPWRHNQRCKGAGVDCVNFLAAVAESVGHRSITLMNYHRLPETERSLAEGLEQFGLIYAHSDLDLIAPCQILLFRATFRGIPQHVAIATDIGIIHASSRAGKVVEHGFGAPYTRLFVSAFNLSIDSQN